MKRIALKTDKRRILVDITDQVARAIGREDGVWLVYVPHTTAGVTINEGADPDVARDILMSWERLVPENLPYRHAEGNAPAHVLAVPSCTDDRQGMLPALGPRSRVASACSGRRRRPSGPHPSASRLRAAPPRAALRSDSPPSGRLL